MLFFFKVRNRLCTDYLVEKALFIYNHPYFRRSYSHYYYYCYCFYSYSYSYSSSSYYYYYYYYYHRRRCTHHHHQYHYKLLPSACENICIGSTKSWTSHKNWNGPSHNSVYTISQDLSRKQNGKWKPWTGSLSKTCDERSTVAISILFSLNIYSRDFSVKHWLILYQWKAKQSRTESVVSGL